MDQVQGYIIVGAAARAAAAGAATTAGQYQDSHGRDNHGMVTLGRPHKPLRQEQPQHEQQPQQNQVRHMARTATLAAGAASWQDGNSRVVMVGTAASAPGVV